MCDNLFTRQFCSAALSLTFRLGLLLALLLLALLLQPVQLVHASDITVNDSGDNVFTDGHCNLREAITNANNDSATYPDCARGDGHDTITITATGVITLVGLLPQLDDDVTISGPGVDSLSISGDNTLRVLYVNSGVAVTITDVTIRDGRVSGMDSGGGVYSAGDLRLNHTRVISNSAYAGGGVSIAQGTATLSGTYILSNSASYGGGMAISQGTVTLTETHVLSNSASGGGGGVLVDVGTAKLSVSGGEIGHNSAFDYGGGMFIARGTATLNETQVSHNVASVGGGLDGGGGVFVDQGLLMLNGARVSNNSAAYGGGLYVGEGTAILTETHVLSNLALYAGGGAFVFQGAATLTTSGGEINYNSTDYYGGGLATYQGTATLSETLVLGNYAAELGGGVYVEQGAAALTGTHVFSNSANMGGGMYVLQGSATLTKTLVLGNDAVLGGGVYVEQGTTVLVETFVSNNSAEGGGGVFVDQGTAILTAEGGEIGYNLTAADGGGVCIAQGTAKLTGTRVLGNSAVRGGGVLVDQGMAVLTDTFVLNNSAEGGGGVFVDQGTATLTADGGEIGYNLAAFEGGGVLVEQGTATLSATHILSNSADNGGGIFAREGTATLSGAHVLGNSAGQGGGLYLAASGAIAASDGCIVNNAALAADNVSASGTLVATDNWWGVPNGPGGAGPGSGDAVSADVDYGSFKTVPTAGCPTLPPALQLRKAVDDDAPYPGQRITYTIAITHSKGVTATDVLISDFLSSDLTFAGPVRLTPPGEDGSGAPPVLVSGATISALGRITLTFPVTVNVGLAAGARITNAAALSSAETPTPQRTGVVTLTVQNVAPLALDDSPSTNEDTPLDINVLSNDYDANGDALCIDAVGVPLNGAVAVRATVIVYTPTQDYGGVEVFTYTIGDGNLSATAAVTVTVRPVNDAPAFIKGAGQIVSRDAGAQIVPGWATGISPGPANEAGQVLTFSLSTDNKALFSVLPAVEESSGDLSYTPVAGMGGSAAVTISLQDDGGSANGGVDVSTALTFTILVTGDVVQVIDPVTGGGLTYTDPQEGFTVTVDIPGQAVTDTLTLIYAAPDSNTYPAPAGLDFAGLAFRLVALQGVASQAGVVFSAPLTLTLDYSPDALGSVDETTLELRYWDGGQWSGAGITLLEHDLSAHRMIFSLAHLTEFALWGQSASLGIVKTVEGAGGGTLNLPFNGVVTYTIVLDNSGGGAARGVVMSDTLPDGVSLGDWLTQGSTLLLAPDGVITWGPGDILAHTAYTFRFTANITNNPAFAGEIISNTARFSSINAGSGSDEAFFSVAPLFVNTPPSISVIPDQETYINIPLVIPFSIGDDETDPDDLALACASSNVGLVPVENITFGGSGANRTVTITPTTGLTGAAVITLTVDDGIAAAVSVFQLTVVEYRIYLPLVNRGLPGGIAITQHERFVNDDAWPPRTAHSR